MALSKTNSTKSYVATGLTTFEFNIPYFDSSDLVVKRQNTDGTVTVLSQTASPANADQYSVTASGNNTENGATITLGGASTNGLTYTIYLPIAPAFKARRGGGQYNLCARN